MTKNNFKEITSHAKEYGFIFQSSEIYDGLSAVYDYGQNGVELKNNIKKYWWDAMVKLNENIVGIDSAIFMEPTVWKASGHVDAFSDPMIDNKDSKKRYRADVLIEDEIQKFQDKIDKDVNKAAKRFGDKFDKETFLNTNDRCIRRAEEKEELVNRFKQAGETEDTSALKQIIIDYKIKCPVSGSMNWTNVRHFNLMFNTEIGSVSDTAGKIYLRPETAQGIFVNYLNIQKTGRFQLPFGIAQIGKAFRNEIVARQFIFRMREFEQMEMQFFIRPGDDQKWFEYWKEARIKWHNAIGMSKDYYRMHDHDKLAHYANAATDVEFKFPFGFKELEGIHSRTNFDLSKHQEFSGKKIQFFDNELQKSYVPYVIETSIGVDRMFLAILSAAYTKEKIQKIDGKTDERIVLKIPPALAPVKIAVLPLVKKDKLPEKAREILNQLKYKFNCQYEEKDSIGKRYRRHDAIGTPYCITVDHQTLEDNSVTIRERDSMSQERVNIEKLSEVVEKKVSMIELLKKAEM